MQNAPCHGVKPSIKVGNIREKTHIRPSELPGLGMASVASTGSRLDGSRNEVWLCQAYDATGQGLMLYVKPKLTPRALLVEAPRFHVGHA